MNCEVCNSTKTKEVLNLSKQPLCDDLIPFNSKKKNKKFLIKIFMCKICSTALQKTRVRNKILFPKNYHYRSKLTDNVLIGMRDLVNSCEKYLGSVDNLKILDIGCNDGSLLNFFKRKTNYTIGIEPTNAAKEASMSHDIYNEYFDKKVVSKIKKKYGDMDIITFTNVFAHINNFENLITNLKKLCYKKTIIVIENHYLKSVLNKNQFDTFYHEHPRTYSFRSFLFISKKLNSFISKVEFPKRYGGNIRVFLGPRSITKNKINSLLNKERNFLKSFKKMNVNIKLWLKNKKKIFKKLNNKYGPLPAKAFPGRASIIINLLKLNDKNIDAIYEKNNSPKIGHYAPGTKIKILSENCLTAKKTNVPIINFAWHISDEIRQYLREKKLKNRIVDIISPSDFK